MIVAEACRLLSGSAGDLTMAKLAKNLNAGVMSLYRYFPNRDVLLDAVAEHFVNLWEAPETVGRPWQDVVLDWLNETQRLWDEHPEALRVIFWNSRHSAAWINVWFVPLARVLKAQGLSDDKLAFALDWLGTSAIGVIVMEADHPGAVPAQKVIADSKLSEPEASFFNGLVVQMAAIDRASLREFSFQNIVLALERLIAA